MIKLSDLILLITFIKHYVFGTGILAMVQSFNETDFLGDIVFSRNMETVAKEITNFEVPSIWLMKAYSNSKNIGQFMKDLQHRSQLFGVVLGSFSFEMIS